MSLPGSGVRFKNAKGIVVRIQEISLPAFPGNGKFGKRHLSSLLKDLFLCPVKAFHMDGTDIGICSAMCWGKGGGSF